MALLISLQWSKYEIYVNGGKVKELFLSIAVLKDSTGKEY
jgi:hypothetical protein